MMGKQTKNTAKADTEKKERKPYKPSPKACKCMSCSRKKEWRESHNGAYYVGPSHSSCTLCATVLVAGWPLYDGTKYKPPAKTPAAAASPSRRVTQPAKSKREVELEKKVAIMEKKLADLPDEDEADADDDATDDPKTAEHFSVVLFKQEADKKAYVDYLTKFGYELEGDSRTGRHGQAHPRDKASAGCVEVPRRPRPSSPYQVAET